MPYINNIRQNLINQKNYTNCEIYAPIKKISYSFSFISLISPFFSSNINFFNQLSTNHKKLLLKQSYVLLTWVYYLSFLENKKDKKNKLKFFVNPVKRRIFTTIKAPIAHKNWSKEQYQIKFYKISINFINNLLEDDSILNVNAALLFVLLSKKNFPTFETNLFFLKYYKFFFFFRDAAYFNYYKNFK